MGGFRSLLRSSSSSFFFIVFFSTVSVSQDTLTATQSLATNQTLSSQKQVFELGFFTSTSSRWFLGIWYKNIKPKTVVWVANRDNPLENPYGILKIGERGNLVLLDQTGNSIWSTNQTIYSLSNPVLQLLDSGNLVLKEANQNDPTKYLWQSFDYPTDTLLPGMKLGWDFDTGKERHLTSWVLTGEDPSTGDFSCKINYQGLPQNLLLNKQQILSRSGPWNGERLSGDTEMHQSTYSITEYFFANEHQVYYSFSIGSESIFRLIVNSNGEFQKWTWIESTQMWSKFWYVPKDQCDYYKECGPFGVCDTNASPVCFCMRGFRPKNLQAWNLKDGSDGCVRNTKLDCEGDKFLEIKNVKLPDTTSVFANRSMTIVECEHLCLKNCNCTAYASMAITNGGTGCVIWSGDLIDIRQNTEGGQTLYVRLAASDVDENLGRKGEHLLLVRARTIVIILAPLVVGVIIFCFTYYLVKIRKRRIDMTILRLQYFGRESTTLEHLQFNLATIEAATNKFSHENSLGRGGFGQVFKGILTNGQEIAVKRLSKGSGQGAEEFKNEVLLIARLQHRNLVALLGFCIDEQEKILVYEYVPNRSLDYFLFGSQNRKVLDWMERSKIIGGIARGILYLHEYSRVKVIHRDLKPSNILLDDEMNPKISDFGLARMVAISENEGSTNRIVGTYGYMSPEYAMFGQYSEKSDVFSFGVIILEIISGKKNTGCHDSQYADGLLSYTWKRWKDVKLVEIMDSNINEVGLDNEVIKCIQIGLLCVQENPNTRPSMATVVSYLSNDSMQLPLPQKPAFFLHPQPEAFITDASGESCSANEASISEFFPR